MQKILDYIKTISTIIENELNDTKCFLVDSTSNGANDEFWFYIDGDNGLDIGISTRLSKRVRNELDEMDEEIMENISFEISSPGVDSPLKMWRQYQQHVGRELEVKTNEGVFVGELLELEEDFLVIDYIKKLKPKKTEKLIIQKDKIQETVVKVSFKISKV